MINVKPRRVSPYEEMRPAGKPHAGFTGVIERVVVDPVPMYRAGVAPLKGDNVDYSRARFIPGIGTYREAAQEAEHAAIMEAWHDVARLPKDLYPEPVVPHKKARHA